MGIAEGDKLTGSVVSVSPFGHIILHTTVRGTSYSGTFITSPETPISILPPDVVGHQAKVHVAATTGFGFDVKVTIDGKKLKGSFVPTDEPVPNPDGGRDVAVGAPAGRGAAAKKGAANAAAAASSPAQGGASSSAAAAPHTSTTQGRTTTTGMRTGTTGTTGTLGRLGARLSRTFGRTTPSMSILRSMTKMARDGKAKELGALLQENEDNMKAMNQNIHDKDRPKYEDGYTLLHHASHHDQTQVIEILIELGHDVNALTAGTETDVEGRSCLFVAARNGSAAATRLLLDKDAAVTLARADTWSIIHAAAGNGRYDCLKIIFDFIPNKDWSHYANIPAAQQGKENWYPLLQACGGGHTDCARFLLDKGADVNGLRSDGASALHWTAAIGNTDCMNLLIQYGANLLLTFPQEYLFTPLHEAARLGYTDCVKALANRLRPNDLMLQDQNGLTAAQLAHAGGFTAIAEYLERLEGGAASHSTAAPRQSNDSAVEQPALSPIAEIAGGAGATDPPSPRGRAPSATGVTDTAYTEASQQLAESSPSPSSQWYNTQNHLSKDMEMSDGFYDAPRASDDVTIVPRMDELALPVTSNREVLVVNVNADPLLRQLVNHAASVSAVLPDDRVKVRVLATLVAQRFGGDRPDLVQKCTDDIESLKVHHHTNLVNIGQITYGVARHRAVMFKRLADACGLVSGLGRGEKCLSEDIRGEGAWNVVTLADEGNGSSGTEDADEDGAEETGGSTSDFVVDLMENPGQLYPVSDEAARTYMWQHRGNDNVSARSGRSAPSAPRFLTLPDLSQPVYIREYLGKGRFSSVSRVSIDGYTCAQKVITYEHMSASDKRKVEQEVKLLASLRHQNIVRCLGSEQKPGEIVIYMEYVPKTLRRLIQSQMRRKRDGEIPFRLRDLLTIATGMAHGVLYLHSQSPPIIHRDLKSPNVLAEAKFDSQGNLQLIEIAKLCDLGIAKVLTATTSAETYTGTIRWMSPEAVALHPMATASSHPVGVWSDIWSLGMVIYELLTGHLPYEGYSENECVNYIRQGTRPALPKDLNDPALEGVVKLFEDCTQYDPASRPDALAVVKRLSVVAAQL